MLCVAIQRGQLTISSLWDLRPAATAARLCKLSPIPASSYTVLTDDVVSRDKKCCVMTLTRRDIGGEVVRLLKALYHHGEKIPQQIPKEGRQEIVSTRLSALIE